MVGCAYDSSKVKHMFSDCWPYRSSLVREVFGLIHCWIFFFNHGFYSCSTCTDHSINWQLSVRIAVAVTPYWFVSWFPQRFAIHPTWHNFLEKYFVLYAQVTIVRRSIFWYDNRVCDKHQQLQIFHWAMDSRTVYSDSFNASAELYGITMPTVPMFGNCWIWIIWWYARTNNFSVSSRCWMNYK